MSIDSTKHDKLLQQNQLLKEELTILRQKEHDLSVINSFATKILHEDTIEAIIWSITQNAIAKLGFLDCVVYLLDEERNILIQKAAHGPKKLSTGTIKNEIIIPLGDGIVGTVAQTGKAEIINDTSKDNRYIVDDEIRYSEIAVPIIAKDKVIGVIDSEHPKKNFYTHHHLEILQTIAAMSSDRIMNAVAHEKLELYKDKLEVLVEERTHELNKAVKNLQQSNEDLELYAHAISHDLKQPLRSINSFISLLKITQKDLSSSSLEYIDFTEKGVVNMENMLDGLLEYSMFKGNKEKEKQLVDFDEIISIAQKNLTYQINISQTDISVPKNLPKAKGHQSILVQLFQNLISNAIKFRQDDKNPLISVNFKESQTHIQFQISDNGIGIEQKKQRDVFNLFARVHDIKKYQGTGLGLSFCKRIVEVHNGEINVSSQGKNQGTTISFSLEK